MVLLIAALGLAIGSFLNVVIGRLRSGETGWRSRSQCPKCHAILRASDLVPVVSFALLRGRCRTCEKPISWQYPAVELSTAGLFVLVFLARGGAEGLLDGGLSVMARDMTFIAALTVIFVVDLLDMVVFDAVTLPMLVVAFAWNLLLGHSWTNLLLAAAVGAGFFLLQYVVSRGRWIGGGDIRIGAMMGAMLGFPLVVGALLLAYIVGSVIALGLLAAKRVQWSGQLAFGTFLSVATVITLLYGDAVWQRYAILF